MVPQPPPSFRPPPNSGPLVLLVDDDHAVLNAIEFALGAEGLQVAGFTHPDAALAARLPALACVVVDHNLPGRTGLDLVDGLRAEGVAAPAILITTAPSTALRRCASERGVEILEKPLLGDVLGRAVRRIIGHA